MNRGGGVHTVPAEGRRGWRNKIVGVAVSYATKKDAVYFGRFLARFLAVEHTIHRRDGVISEKNSYGRDPFPPRDRD